MFNKKTTEAIEALFDAVYLLQDSIVQLKEEIDYLADSIGLND